MTDIQQVEGAAVVSYSENWTDQYSGDSQGVPGMSLNQLLEYGGQVEYVPRHSAPSFLDRVKRSLRRKSR